MIKGSNVNSIFILGLLAAIMFALIASPSQVWAAPDRDGDGIKADKDCNDNDIAVYPGAPEICDSIDNQCPGDSGYGLIDENDAGVEGAACTGGCVDADEDGVCGDEGDCNDANPNVYPGAPEICDGIDNQCPQSSSSVDEEGVCQVSCTDEDGDGYYVESQCNALTDCNDDPPDPNIGYAGGYAINPGVSEICDNGIDDDCDDQTSDSCGGGVADTDQDGFDDTWEQQTQSLPTGWRLAANGAITISPCTDGTPPDLMDTCMHWQVPDYYVIVERSRTGCPDPTDRCQDQCGPSFYSYSINGAGPFNSNLPHPDNYDTEYNPLELIPDNITGLGIAVKEIILDNGVSAGDGAIGPHFAARLVENANPCAPFFGIATPGVLAAGSVGTIYPEKIKNWTVDACSEACFTDKDGNEECYLPNDPEINSFVCKNANSSTTVNMVQNEDLAPLQKEIIQNVANHEESHLIALANGANVLAGHYEIGEGVVMEQFMDAKATKGGRRNDPPDITITIYVSVQYSSESQQGYQLTGP